MTPIHTISCFKTPRAIVIATVLLTMNGCTTLGYYSQSVFGHLGIMMERQDISDILADDNTPATLKQKLELVLEARKFASVELGLPDNGSYSSYADTKQRYVIWNVFATPKYSLKLKEWCFVFAGCVGYRGYFAEQDARDFAAALEEQGLEAYVGGSLAYSTLGWFDDPVLNTFVHYQDIYLAGLIFHELAHQQLYVKNDTAFNEGFAKTVEIEGVKRWLISRASSDHVNNSISDFKARKQKQKQFNKMIADTVSEMRKLYASGESEQVMSVGKAAVIEKLKALYEKLKVEQWDGYTGYDEWMGRGLTNAQLASMATYHDNVPAFRQLLNEEQGDFIKFFAAAKKVGDMPKEERSKRLAELQQRGRLD